MLQNSAWGVERQIRSTQPWTMLSLSRWQSMEAVHNLPTYLLTHSRTDPRTNFTSVPYFSFLKREHQICCSTRGHLLGSNKHTHLPQTDSPAQDAQHGEDQHDQVLLFLNCNFLHICAIYVYHSFLAFFSPNKQKLPVAYNAGGTKSKKEDSWR